MNIEKTVFGVMPDGKTVNRYFLHNTAGMTVSILNLGGTVQQILVPDAKGRLTDVVGGYDSLYDYLTGDGYQGALIGRFGNRIADGRFELDGNTYTLFCNDGKNHLHGGKEGFNHKIFDVITEEGDEPALHLHYLSKDGEEGYPGNLDVRVTYRLKRDCTLSIRYTAVTDKATVLNLTNHSYFNLSGFASGSILNHLLYLDADRYLPTDEGLIPTGELRSVAGTPFDFRKEKPIGRDFSLSNEDMGKAGGYDHCFCFTGGESEQPVLRAVLFDPASGRGMKVITNQPCVQCYTANFLCNPEHPFKGGFPQGKQNAVCLETQHMPDSIHHAGFDNTVLRPGETYDYTTEYTFFNK